MKNLKQSFLPLRVMVLGAVAAFATTTKTSGTFAPETGYASINAPCDWSVNCRTEIGEICTVRMGSTDHQAFGKDLLTNECNVILYKVN